MSERVSPYIVNIRTWKIRDIIENYIHALHIFKLFNQEFVNGNDVSFKDLRRISDCLWTAKDGNYQLYRRIVNPKRRKFEKARKFIPNENQIAFMNNVGLLFHKVFVARELKYVLEHYEENSEEYQETLNEFVKILRRIQYLFAQGTVLMLKILEYQSDNIPLLTFLLESQTLLEQATSQKIEAILAHLLGENCLEKAYFQVGKFYFESGWVERARLLLIDALKIQPNHAQVKKLLKKCEEKIVQLNGHQF
jgi:hypothetical protein